MGPAPNDRHQQLSADISGHLWSFLRGHDCRMRSAPYDIRLPRKTENNEDIITVLQPDICVICDKTKIDKYGCLGAPDIVVEILSPGNNAKELKNKFAIYEEAGVKEYWIVSPQDEYIVINKLVDGKYITFRPMVTGDVITTSILPGFALRLEELFSQDNH